MLYWRLIRPDDLVIVDVQDLFNFKQDIFTIFGMFYHSLSMMSPNMQLLDTFIDYESKLDVSLRRLSTV